MKQLVGYIVTAVLCLTLGAAAQQSIDVPIPGQDVTLPSHRFRIEPQTIRVELPSQEPQPLPVIPTEELADLERAYQEMVWQIQLLRIPAAHKYHGSYHRAYEAAHAVYRELHFALSQAKQSGDEWTNLDERVWAEQQAAYERWRAQQN